MEKGYPLTGAALQKIKALCIAAGLAVVTGALLIFITAEDPVFALELLLAGPTASINRLGNVLELMTPLIFTGLSFCLIFSAGQFSMLSEGAFFAGGLAAAFCALALPGTSWILPVLAGMLAGAMLSLLPAFMKIWLEANELVVSLMMNYVVLYAGLFLFNRFIRDAAASVSVSREFAGPVRLPVIINGTRVHLGIIMALALCLLLALFLYGAKWGYQIRITGFNAKFSAFAGINITGTILLSSVLGGLLAGMGGAVEIVGMYKRFSWTQLPGYGFDGVLVALMAGNNPASVPVAAFFIAYMRVGSDIMARSTNVAAEMILLIQGLLLFMLSIKQLPFQYRQIRRGGRLK